MRSVNPVAFPARTVVGLIQGLCQSLYFCEEKEKKTDIKERKKKNLRSAGKIPCKVEEVDARAIDTVFVYLNWKQ